MTQKQLQEIIELKKRLNEIEKAEYDKGLELCRLNSQADCPYIQVYSGIDILADMCGATIDEMPLDDGDYIESHFVYDGVIFLQLDKINNEAGA